MNLLPLTDWKESLHDMSQLVCTYIVFIMGVIHLRVSTIIGLPLVYPA